MDFLKNSKGALNKTAEFIIKGGVVVCPTDTVYGFLADASSKKAVEKIYKIKKRPRQKPLAIFVKDLKAAKKLAEINEKQEKILKKKWPGRFTFILKRKPSKLYGLNKDTIALRIPKYKFLNDLLKKINRPLAQTSVNISGQPPLTKISDIVKVIGRSDLPMIIIDAGELKKAKVSVIIDITQDILTRMR